MSSTRRPPRRRSSVKPDAELLRRLTDVEEMARANRRELELQFQRMAQMQVELDKLKAR